MQRQRKQGNAFSAALRWRPHRIWSERPGLADDRTRIPFWRALRSIRTTTSIDFRAGLRGLGMNRSSHALGWPLAGPRATQSVAQGGSPKHHESSNGPARFVAPFQHASHGARKSKTIDDPARVLSSFLASFIVLGALASLIDFYERLEVGVAVVPADRQRTQRPSRSCLLDS